MGGSGSIAGRAKEVNAPEIFGQLEIGARRALGSIGFSAKDSTRRSALVRSHPVTTPAASQDGQNQRTLVSKRTATTPRRHFPPRPGHRETPSTNESSAADVVAATTSVRARARTQANAPLHDCATDGLSPELLGQAARQALRPGLAARGVLGAVADALVPIGGIASIAQARALTSRRPSTNARVPSRPD